MTAASIVAMVTTGSAGAAQGPVPTGIPRLDHVFVIMMENHAYGQIAGNAAGAVHQCAHGQGQLRTNYFAIAHPSSTNYLEVVGGSNFNDLSDQYPNWHSSNCIPNMVPGSRPIPMCRAPAPSARSPVRTARMLRSRCIDHDHE